MDLHTLLEIDPPALCVDEAPILFAMDRSMRSVDQDGHLHVETVNISKANVCPYLGREIPNGVELGLDPDATYMLYRDAAELEAAAPTFENKQLMFRHVGVTANDPHEYETVGVVSGVYWQAPYLKARLTLWSQRGIDAVVSQAQKELSSGYRYSADMTPGTIDGVKYDGIMRNIRGNHVALVSEGRVGPDVFVTDELPEAFMKTSILAAALVATLGLDKKPEDVKAAIDTALAADKKAKDEAECSKAEKEAMDKKAKDEKEAEEKAAADKAAKDKASAGGDEDPDMDDTDAEDGTVDPSTGRAPEGGAPNPAKDKKAMDAAVKLAVDAAIAGERALGAARREVEPLLGVVAYDSAAEVYRAALTHLSVDTAGIHESALAALYRATVKAAPAPLAHDHAPGGVKTMDQAFPGFNRLRK